VRLDLATMLLRDRGEDGARAAMPTLIVAPFALHDSSIADFAREHSLAEAFAAAGLGEIAMTQWKSATEDMRDFGIDAYLSDLNVAVDDLGGRVALVGLCQGGWLATAYAARFPKKVGALVLAGAPIDLGAADSEITRSLAGVSPGMLESIVSINGGRVMGQLALPIWAHGMRHEFDAQETLQRSDDPVLLAKATAWNAYTVDLPGVYFLQTSEWLFRENRLARNCFRALGRYCSLHGITAPIFVLAASDDEIVALPQALAVKTLCPQANITARVVPGRHLSLFLGRDTLTHAWVDVATWLKQVSALPLPDGRGLTPVLASSKSARGRGRSARA
jgi:poly(3-hydroxyalkanoate) synthetase